MSGRIYEYRDVSASQEIVTDVCIIGSGCGGATLAFKLTEAGVDVVILEQGGYYPPSSFDNNELSMAGKISAERNMSTTTSGVPVMVYGQNVGGASVHYWADSYRTPDDRLELWEQEYGVEGHGVSALAPMWEELDRRLHVHPAPERSFNRMNKIMREAAAKLGWHGAPVPQARRGCQGSGHCQHGCAFNAKQSQLITSIPDAVARGARVYADARATRLVHDGGTVSKLVARMVDRPSNRENGIELTVKAKAFVVAGGGYNSAALLMRNGLGKGLPALGKYLAVNPSPFVHGIYDEKIIQWRNIPTSYGIDEFRLARYKDSRYVEGGYLLMANQLHPPSLAVFVPGWGEDHHRVMKQAQYVGGTTGWIDDVPSELGRIEVDSSGRRKVVYDQGPITNATILDMLKKQAMIHFAGGAREVIIPDRAATTLRSLGDLGKIHGVDVRPGMIQWVAPHPAGGCRMGRDPRDTVVGSDHRVHGFRNLFVADSSVFPTGPSVDPSYTIMAFAYIAAGHIQAHVGDA
jgi:choline dehydrogenase-like flavoprotein